LLGQLARGQIGEVAQQASYQRARHSSGTAGPWKRLRHLQPARH